MRVSDAFPSEFLKAGDIANKQVRVVIDRVEMRDVGDDHKPVIFFEGKEKGVVLNVTNARAIAQYHGEEMEEWVGQEIILFTMMVNFQGRMQPGIRIRVPSSSERKTAAKPASTPPPSENPGADLDDEIPF
jgi:hypothetical protein